MSDTTTTEAADTTRVTLSLPTALLRELDARLVNGHTTRDATIQRLIEEALRDFLGAAGTRDQDTVSGRVRRFAREERESEDEFGWTTSPAALAHLAEIPWDSDAEPSGGPNSRRRGVSDPSS